MTGSAESTSRSIHWRGQEWPAAVARPRSTQRLPGGWVATTWLATLDDGSLAVVKRSPYPAELEAEGLAALAAAGVPVPDVHGYAGGTLVLELVRGEPDWAGLGSAVAGMHAVVGGRFGWHRDNRAGRFVQHNEWSGHWPTFFVERRLLPHLQDPFVPSELRRRLERACDGPIQALLPDHPPASLTHGDLWRGNVVDGRWLVDPEVSYADRELDLAYMQMSSSAGLPAQFWSAYTERLPVAEGYQDRRRVLELHHRLLHIRHFGASGLDALHALLAEHGW